MAKIEDYIEEVGLFYERFGLPRMAGRILGYLMASKEDDIAFEDIKEQLKASKGSISGNLKLLLAQKLIEKYALPGNRKSYFRFSNRDVFNMLDDKISSVRSIIGLYSGANDINDPTSKKHGQLAEVLAFYTFLEIELPKLRQRWMLNRKNIK